MARGLGGGHEHGTHRSANCGRFQPSNKPVKKSDTLLRHWRMLRDIPRHPRRISTVELLERLLAAGFEATLRTVQRDLVKLSASHPLMSDDAKPQGWSWQANAPQINLPTLEPHAALVFHLAEHYLRPLLPATTLDYLTPWFHTASGVLDNQSTELADWRAKVRILASGQPLLPPVIDPEVQRVVTLALLQNRRVAVRYRPRSAVQDKEYEASPLGLVVRDQVIYLVCTLREYADVKQLVLSRIQSAELLCKPARPSPTFNLDEYIASGEFGISVNVGLNIKLVADFSREAALTFVERPLAADQTVEEVGHQTLRLTAQVPDTLELRRWLLGFGAYAVVLEPISLRAEMRALVQQMVQSYSADEE